ncbi:substrate-binding domain-containing protein [Eubacteriales bacterium OttesenSCG-928-N13]|nr:substrate-binding domain-containing protein [Eubacteriales bacterium OttesenSCG-928-N13]
MKKIIVILLMLLILNGPALAEGKVYGCSIMNLYNPFYQQLESSLRMAVEAHGDTLISYDACMDPSRQLEQVQLLIAANVDAVFLNPVNVNAVEPAIARLHQNGIPIINLDNEVEDLDSVDAFVGSNNFHAGYLCGQDLAARHPDGGNILLLDAEGQSAISDRMAGIHQALMDAGIYYRIEQLDARGERSTARRMLLELLDPDQPLLAILAGNDHMAMGALEACLSAERAEIELYGVDGSPDAKCAIFEHEQFILTAAQSPHQIGQQAAEIAHRITGGQSYDFRTAISTFPIDRENLAEWDMLGWQ